MALLCNLAPLDEYKSRLPLGKFPVTLQRQIRRVAIFIGIAAFHGMVHDPVRGCFAVNLDRYVQLRHGQTSCTVHNTDYLKILEGAIRDEPI
jgi:hypothetical protein